MNLFNIDSNPFHFIGNARLVVGSNLIYDTNYRSLYSVDKFDSNNELLPEEISTLLGRYSKSNNIEFFFNTDPKHFTILEKTVIPFNLAHPYNYFHFLIESLPNIYFLLKEGLLDPDFIILTSHLNHSFYNALRIVLGDNYNRLLQINWLDSVECKKVLVAPSASIAYEKIDKKTPIFKFNDEKIISLKKYFRKYDNDINDRKNIFVVRNSNYRILKNQNEIAEIAKKRGYLVIDPGQLSFFDQMRLFSSAKKIVGPTGAWLANMLFVQSDCPINVFYPNIENNPVNNIWNGLGLVLGVEVNEIYCKVEVMNKYQPIHSDYYIDPMLLNEIL
jgi:hypothetical protein